MDELCNVFTVWHIAQHRQQIELSQQAETWLKERGVTVRDENPLARALFRKTGTPVSDFRELLKAKAAGDKDAAWKFDRKLSGWGYRVHVNQKAFSAS